MTVPKQTFYLSAKNCSVCDLTSALGHVAIN